MMKHLKMLFPYLVILAAWELSVRSGLATKAALPAPSDLVATFFDLSFSRHVLLRHLGGSLYRLSIGFAASIMVGLTLGTVLAMSKNLRDMFMPVVNFLMSVPTIAWVPLLLISFGLGDATVIGAIFLGGLFEMIHGTSSGMRMVPRQQVNAAKSMGVKGLQLFLKVMLPASMVNIFPTLRLCLGYCWRALVGGEMLSAMVQWGVGKMIYEARFWNDISVMFLGLALIGALGMLLDRALLFRLEKRTIVRWGMTSS